MEKKIEHVLNETRLYMRDFYTIYFLCPFHERPGSVRSYYTIAILGHPRLIRDANLGLCGYLFPRNFFFFSRIKNEECIYVKIEISTGVIAFLIS